MTKTKLKPARYRAILAYAMEAHYDCMPIEEIRELSSFNIGANQLTRARARERGRHPRDFVRVSDRLGSIRRVGLQNN